jgi:hypothetical protein
LNALGSGAQGPVLSNATVASQASSGRQRQAEASKGQLRPAAATRNQQFIDVKTLSASRLLRTNGGTRRLEGALMVRGPFEMALDRCLYPLWPYLVEASGLPEATLHLFSYLRQEQQHQHVRWFARQLGARRLQAPSQCSLCRLVQAW